MPCLHNFAIMSQALAWSPATGAITTQPTGWITVWPAWLFICCWDNSPAEQRGRTHTHQHKTRSILSVMIMHNTCITPLPFILYLTVACYSSPYLLLSSFPHPPIIMYYYNHAPLAMSFTISSLPPSCIFRPLPIPSHPSPRLPTCPGRLQMVLNGRITERNCFVNNSTGTRWATGQPACMDTEERCTHATHTCMRYQVK